jgi:carbon-monoxide dehydrogenase small subunit
MLVKVAINGEKHEAEVEPRLLLVHMIRENLRLTGTHIGCDTSHCGACTVLLDGRPVSSCLVLAPLAEGREILTVEGLEAEDGTLHPVQQAFVDHTAFQCAYCTPGFVLSVKAMLDENPCPSEHEIREYLAGNLCRCGSYVKILAAALDARERLREPPARG